MDMVCCIILYTHRERERERERERDMYMYIHSTSALYSRKRVRRERIKRIENTIG